MEIPFNLPVICPIIIGRTSELTTLCLLIEQVKSGKGHVALISGEAGVGKSRLAGEAVELDSYHLRIPCSCVSTATRPRQGRLDPDCGA